MSLIEQISNDLIGALKEKDNIRVSTLRLLKSAIKNKEISLSKSADEAMILEVIAKEIKQRRDSTSQYQQGGRNDLAEKEQAELKILQDYLPQQLSQNEINKIVNTAINETKAAEPKDIGKVMAIIMPQIKSKADPSFVSQMLKNKLSK